VVFIFIFATGGLLAWALLKPWVEKYIEVSKSSINKKGKGTEANRCYLNGLLFLFFLFVETAANIFIVIV
jgi:hypothetical protein